MDAMAEQLPYEDMRFDFLLMMFCISYFQDVTKAFKEAFRLLKKDGSLIVGFLDSKSIIGKSYEQNKSNNIFYKQATFYTVNKVVEDLNLAGFRHLEFNQTLFGSLDSINKVQTARKGFGDGSFVVVKALKKNSTKRKE